MAAIARTLRLTESWLPIIRASNEVLHAQKLNVSFSQVFSTPPGLVNKNYELLDLVYLEQGGKREPIDIFSINSLASLSSRVSGLVFKVEEHIKSKENPQILISPSGRKLNVKLLESMNNPIQMDRDGTLKFKGSSVKVIFRSSCVVEGDKNPLSSCSVVQAIPCGGRIYFVDLSDYNAQFQKIICGLNSKGELRLFPPERVMKQDRQQFFSLFEQLSLKS